ncbi:MAG: lytic murein transglycosylase [Alphaproteobacteria bacterium]
MRRNIRKILSVAGWLALIGSSPALAADDFATWLDGVRAEALGKGIRAEILDQAFAGVQPIPRVIELDRKQPEFTLTFPQYLDRVVPDSRKQRGRARYGEHKAMLDAIGKKYGVQPRFVVALWGIETDFGRVTGGFPVIASLATLAHDGRRSAYFRGELMHALNILNGGHITADRMMGSWAGAMGQPQFMPSSFNNFAVDENGDGRRDIWETQADVFASAANYLARVGWRDDITWGRKVTLPAGFDLSLASLDIEKRLSEWQALGVRRADGGDLPDRDLPASLVLPVKDSATPAYLVYQNYRNILKWNRSTYFALAVGHLSDAIGGLQ